VEKLVTLPGFVTGMVVEIQHPEALQTMAIGTLIDLCKVHREMIATFLPKDFLQNKIGALGVITMSPKTILIVEEV
jgi:hypothetical protein